MSNEIILKKIISADHIYGIKYYNNSLFLSNIFNEYISKVEIYNNYKKEKLFNIKKEWKKFQFFKKDENNFKGIHSIQPLNNNLFFSISYLRKKLILIDLKNKKILNFPKINNYLKGSSHIDYIKKKSLLLISDYDGGEVYLFNYKKKIFKKFQRYQK